MHATQKWVETHLLRTTGQRRRRHRLSWRTTVLSLMKSQRLISLTFQSLSHKNEIANSFFNLFFSFAKKSLRSLMVWQGCPKWRHAHGHMDYSLFHGHKKTSSKIYRIFPFLCEIKCYFNMTHTYVMLIQLLMLSLKDTNVKKPSTD